jgi:3-deoxy-D-manno-octulosonate 8-phosphate phosphatase (KDO 8-P phosphatase)
MSLPMLLEQVNGFVFDMDGVLTDATIWLHGDGSWVRRMHIRDGYALQLAVRKGYPICVISGSDAPPVRDRLHMLGVSEVHMGVKDKREVLDGFLSRCGLKAAQVLYMGDDVPDIAAMRVCGVSACPHDAARDVRSIAQYVSPIPGGAGCVRDVIERVLRLHDRWDDDAQLQSL